MITFNNPRKGDVEITLVISGASSLLITPTTGNPRETNPDPEEVRFINIIYNFTKNCSKTCLKKF